VPPWKKSRRLVQSKTPANEIDIADGLDNYCRKRKREGKTMLVKCFCQQCNGHIEFDEGYAGMPIICPHCGSGTNLFIPSGPLPPPKIKPKINLENTGAGCDVLPGQWMDDPMSEKQKAMFVLYGIPLAEGLTKGDAATLIDNVKKSGNPPSEENQARAEKLFNAIEGNAKKDRLKEVGGDFSEVIRLVQRKKTTVKELQGVKEKFEELCQELAEIIDDRICEVDDAECARQAKEDEKQELGELD
jgi:hypothetical protein